MRIIRLLLFSLFITAFIILQANLISAGLCKGTDGYYHECGYVSYYYHDGVHYKTIIDLDKKQIYDDRYRDYNGYSRNRYYSYDYDYKYKKHYRDYDDRYYRDKYEDYDRYKSYHKYYPTKYYEYDDYYETSVGYRINFDEALYSYNQPLDYPGYYVHYYTYRDHI